MSMSNYAEKKLDDAIIDIEKYCIDEGATVEVVHEWERLWKKLHNLKPFMTVQNGMRLKGKQKTPSLYRLAKTISSKGFIS